MISNGYDMVKRPYTILIANRGAIARRIIRTCRRMGIAPTVACTAADRDAPWVREASLRVCVSSYLAIEEIVAAATACGARAIHPGYGFLAENPALAEACGQAGIVFVGPSARSIRLAGDKVAAKQTALTANVPTVPGVHEALSDPAMLRTAAREIGYPLLVKAAAGGGGKGMRRVDDERGLHEAVAAAQREAQSAFGDDRIYLEQYLSRPRHIEFQIAADRQGNIVHLFERECSLQRRHQKIIEEAPSPIMTPALRAQMGDAAVRFAKAVGYENVGTVEFLVDDQQRYYFLEMNTRLQVEHAVTEMVMRTPQSREPIDLVEWQLRIAASEPLPVRQDELTLSGHAIEARVYAEDPARDFLPCTGTVRFLREPAGAAIRMESGLCQGMDVTIDYDPMLAKLIAWAPSRGRALQRLLDAVQAYAIDGVITNRTLLQDLLRSSEMVAGHIDTHFVERFLVDWSPRNAVACDPFTPWQQRVHNGGWRLGGERTTAPSSALRQTSRRPRRVRASGDLKAPMPGRIISVLVTEGAQVAADDVLVVMEAMKMEYAIRAPKEGVVTRVACAVGEQVALGAELIEMELQ